MTDYSPDTIRILVSSDNHVGYAEGDGERTDDSWQTFDEVLSLAQEHDVDMVLLGGDLFHDNHPSRKAMSEVMKSLSKHCQGDKPVSLEIIGDQSEHFPGQMNQVNYMNPNINISIPVFSIHGNHDDPTGPEHKSALDLLHDGGLLNYYGRVPQADKIDVKPLLLQKGTTKLALYGLSNVRDERLFQTFRDHGVRFFSPSQAKDEWYNILSVHQNHTPHTDTSYLPEASLPANMDMIIWGHEHECKIEPRTNPDLRFRVMQPGSTIATSLIPGEAVPKKVAILNIVGKKCTVEPVVLRSVRPFVYRDIILREEKKMRDIATKANNLPQVKQFCKAIIEEMITEAHDQWLENNPQYDPDNGDKIPLPLIRLRVEYTAPEGGEYHVEQNQRFSQEYRGRVANVNDVIQFHKRRTISKRLTGLATAPDAEVLEELGLETVKVSDLVREFLTAQSLTMLPQNLFSDAVGQFVDKGDKKAMDLFVADSLKVQVDSLVHDGADEDEDAEEDQMAEAMAAIKAQQEERFKNGEIKARKGNSKRLLPKPADWDTDEQGSWSDYPGARAGDDVSDDEEDEDSVASGTRTGTARGRGGRGTRARGRGGRTAAAATTRKTATKPATKPKGRKQLFEEDSDEDDDIMIIDDDDDNDEVQDVESNGLFVSQASSAPARKTARAPAPRKAAPAPAAAAKQSKLSFATPASSAARSAPVRAAAKPVARRREPSEDEIDSDDDAFESAVPVSRARRR